VSKAIKSAVAGWRRGAGPILLLAAGAAAGMHPVVSRDLWRHLATGRWILQAGRIPVMDHFSFTMQGRPWLEFEWLYQLLLQPFYRLGGPVLLTLLHAAAGVTALALAYRVARRYAAPAAAGWALLVCVFALAPRMTVRPHLLTLPISMLFMDRLSRLESEGHESVPIGTLLGLALLETVWANLSPTFILGPMVVAAYFAERILRRRLAGERWLAGVVRCRGLMFLGLLTLGATLVNPFGVRIYGTLLAHWNDPARAFIVEWESPFSGTFGLPHIRWLITGVLIVSAAGFAAARRRIPVAVMLLMIWSAAATWRSVRFLDQLATFGMPFLAFSLEETADVIGGVVARGPGRVLKAVWKGYGIAALGVLWLLLSNRYYGWLGSGMSMGLGVKRDVFPCYAVKVMKHPDFPGRTFNFYGDGGYLEWALPERRVFMDGRSTLFSPEPFRSYRAALALKPHAWDRLVARYGLDAALVNTVFADGIRFAAQLNRRADWRLVYFDGTSAVFIRKGRQTPDLSRWLAAKAPEGMHLIDAALEECRRGSRRPRLPGGLAPISWRLLGAAGFYMECGDYRRAAEIYRVLAETYRHRAFLWRNLSICLASSGRPEEARKALQEGYAYNPRDKELRRCRRLLEEKTPAGVTRADGPAGE